MAAIAGLGGPLSGLTPTERPTARSTSPAGQAVTHSPGSRATGALPRSADAASCAFGYSPRAVADRPLAFDGTVAAIGPGHSDRPGPPAIYVGVTFTVNEWFAGGSAPTVTVDLPPPFSHLPPGADGPAAYDVGTRLLVSGGHRWGGITMADAVAWGCDFTRYYDPGTADTWRAATR